MLGPDNVRALGCKYCAVSSNMTCPMRILLADVNDDLRADLVVIFDSTVYALYANGTAFLPQYLTTNSSVTASAASGGSIRQQAQLRLRSTLADLRGHARSLLANSYAALTASGNSKSGDGTHEPAPAARGTDALSLRQKASSQSVVASVTANRHLHRAVLRTNHSRLLTADGQHPHKPVAGTRASFLGDSMSGGGRQVRLLGMLDIGDLAVCQIHPYGVDIALNVPGDQILVACPSGKDSCNKNQSNRQASLYVQKCM